MNTEKAKFEAPMVSSGFGISDPKHTFDNFKVLPGTAITFQAFKDLAEGTTYLPFLLCYGGVGNGKTHLMEATYMKLRERGLRGTLWVFAELLSFFRRIMNGQSIDDLDTIIERYQSAEFLLLDDVGMEYGTNWEESVLERIVSGRYRARLITVITTNKDLDQVDERGRRCIPERVVSRFFDSQVGVVSLNEGLDYRRLKGK